MRARAVVPQKPLFEAKSRLEGVLSAADRAALSLALLRHVCTAVAAADGVERVVVMTPDAAVRAQAAAWGIEAVSDPCPGLNAALNELARAGPRSRSLLIMAADLPLLGPADVAALLAAAGDGRLVLAPSKEATGTNAIVIPPGTGFRPEYGGASLAVHRRRARLLGLAAVEVRRPGLAFDLDTEADLASLRYCGTPAFGVAPLSAGWSAAPAPGAAAAVFRCGWR